MRSRYEVVLKRVDGSVRILVEYPESGRPWLVSVQTRAKRARSWYAVVDWHSYAMRQRTAEEREQVARDKVLAVVTLEELMTAVQQAWDLYRPTMETIERAIYR